MTNPSTSTRRLRGCPTVLFNPTYALAFQDNTLSVIEHLPGVDEEMCVRASIHIRWAKYLQSHICSIMAQDAGRWNVDLSSELSALFSASPQNTERRIPLGENSAARLTVLFRLVDGIDDDRDLVSMGAKEIAAMSNQEVSYWCGMILHRPHPRRVVLALRAFVDYRLDPAYEQDRYFPMGAPEQSGCSTMPTHSPS
jgi:hypothetical protein